MAMTAGASAAMAAGAAIGNMFNTWYNSNSAKKAAKAAYAYNIASMNHQYQLTRELNRNAYQDTTFSMREAGINPMLAINQGINGLTAGSGANISQQAAQSDLDLASALQLKNDSDRLKNETALNTENIANTKANTVNTQANTANTNEVTKSQAIANKYAEQKNQEEIKLLKAEQQNQLNQGQSALVQASNSTRMTDSNIALNSAKSLESAANTKYQNERNRGFTTSGSVGIGPVKVQYSHTGNSAKSNAHVSYENINGRVVPVTNF